MLNQVGNENLLINSGIAQQNKVSEAGAVAGKKNPYAVQAEFGDSLEISEEAKKLYEKEQEINKYKSMVIENLDKKEQVGNILDLIKTGEYINNDDLAKAMMGDEEFLTASELIDILFSDNIA